MMMRALLTKVNFTVKLSIWEASLDQYIESIKFVPEVLLIYDQGFLIISLMFDYNL